MRRAECNAGHVFSININFEYLLDGQIFSQK